MVQPILSIRNISKVYNPSSDAEVRALNGVSIDIQPGEVLALLGINGAGKTTLSSILATLHPPTSGDILYNGASIYDNIWSYRKSLGFCPQHANLDPYLTVEENLVFSGQYFGMSRLDAISRAQVLIKRYQLTKYRAFFVGQLSGGNRQRVLIARSVMHNPRVVILDEPTVALDPDIRHRIWQEIVDLKSQGVTIILTTHYLEEAERLADRVCLLHDGKVRMQNSVTELKKAHDGTSLETIFLRLTKQELKHE